MFFIPDEASNQRIADRIKLHWQSRVEIEIRRRAMMFFIPDEAGNQGIAGRIKLYRQ